MKVEYDVEEGALLVSAPSSTSSLSLLCLRINSSLYLLWGNNMQCFRHQMTFYPSNLDREILNYSLCSLGFTTPRELTELTGLIISAPIWFYTKPEVHLWASLFLRLK
jgi:hypothetical protein